MKKLKIQDEEYLDSLPAAQRADRESERALAIAEALLAKFPPVESERDTPNMCELPMISLPEPEW